MKGHLEIFEHRLKNMAEKLPNIQSINLDDAFLEFEASLGNTLPFYDVNCGSTLADYYTSAFMQFIKTKLANAPVATKKPLADYVRTIPDFPEPGIMFRDITTVLQDAEGFQLAIDSMMEAIADIDFDIFVLIDSRGFLFGSPMAYNLKKPIALVRKKGKLPFSTISQEYELEYGTSVLEMHTDAIIPGHRAIIVDDLIATGGTIKATCQLVEKLGGTVAGIVALTELEGLEGRKALEGYRVESIIQYPGK